jgi:protein-S-isoprenylcysteine O-methyltransferase Ste14
VARRLAWVANWEWRWLGSESERAFDDEFGSMTNSGAKKGSWWVAGQSVIMALVLVASMIWRNQWHSAWTFGLGIGLFVLGGIVGVLGVLHLGRNRTAFPRPLADSTLVESGVYGVVRHPLYASVMLACLGWSGIWSSGPGAVVALVLVGYLDAKARREERWLRERYATYAAYARRVKRFIPSVY